MDSKVRVATWDRHNPVFCSLELFCRFRLRWLPNANPRPLLKSRILRFTKQSALGFPKFSLLRPWRPFCPFLHTHAHRKCQMAPNRKSETTLLCYFFTFTKQNFFRFWKFSLMRPWRPFCCFLHAHTHRKCQFGHANGHRKWQMAPKCNSEGTFTNKTFYIY